MFSTVKSPTKTSRKNPRKPRVRKRPEKKFPIQIPSEAPADDGLGIIKIEKPDSYEFQISSTESISVLDQIQRNSESVISSENLVSAFNDDTPLSENRLIQDQPVLEDSNSMPAIELESCSTIENTLQNSEFTEYTSIPDPVQYAPVKTLENKLSKSTNGFHSSKFEDFGAQSDSSTKENNPILQG